MVLLTPSTGVTVFDSAFFEFVLPVRFSQLITLVFLSRLNESASAEEDDETSALSAANQDLFAI